MPRDRSTGSCTRPSTSRPDLSSTSTPLTTPCRTWRDIAPAIQPDSNQAEKGIRIRMRPSDAPSSIPAARGDWSDLVIRIARDEPVSPPPPDPDDPLADDDMQLALYLCYELVYRGLEGVPVEKEWDLDLLAVRLRMERAFQDALLQAVPPTPVAPRTCRLGSAISTKRSRRSACTWNTRPPSTSSRSSSSIARPTTSKRPTPIHSPCR